MVLKYKVFLPAFQVLNQDCIYSMPLSDYLRDYCVQQTSFHRTFPFPVNVSEIAFFKLSSCFSKALSSKWISFLKEAQSS